ncbi:hypothetical protein LY01_00101 [Nonlabens xylanidelens]|uniref:Gll0560 protein n=1 Tax=Nonlabens xylanidelens TaxID=191564 RepID=A0A2S6IQ41_9FLAO|nr:hypothetical protein [Nonlabens xylanidelens]PPK96285.1 hypothetical protein LY01_00101 [Nonlabens xylanidelens]PQJ18018.1 hypothetical protein BST94_08365 [Nonlabens xylanidelens]
MKQLVLIILIALSIHSCKTVQQESNRHDKPQRITTNHVTDLAQTITETSGLEYYQNQIITHNDSGDTPTLYFLDTLGNLLYHKTYKHMTAIDWEDVTKDDEYLYIADLGNNYGDRKDLTIFKIALTDLQNENATVTRLNINYPDQKSFERGEQNHPYDAESIVAIEENLYVFSKDWKDQTTIIYKIDKNKQRQTAQNITFYNIKGLVTGATYNGSNTVTVCGYNSNLIPFVHRINYQNGKFEFAKKEELLIEGGAQIEGIISIHSDSNKETYYLSSEATNIKLGEDEALTTSQLYKVKWLK